jgi:isoleucyl-tRNA synthetase
MNNQNKTTTTIANPYPEVSSQPDFPTLEKVILKYWVDANIFQKSIDQRNDQEEFVFYDGPPFANGLPHHGHILTGYIKDIIPRFKTMRGHKVDRRFGWDCHGLPAEMEAEKELGVQGCRSIEEYGIAKFNSYCRSSVLKYTKEWEEFVTRQARWVDFANDYKTLDLPFMESTIWAFKQLWDKGLVYEGVKVVPYSWACETVLSYAETRQDNAFRSRQDPALTVSVKLKQPLSGNVVSVLIWTTTPWTLPSNLAVAVAKDVKYVVIATVNGNFLLAEEALTRYGKEFSEPQIIQSFMGADLVGLEYEPIMPYFKDLSGAFKIIAGDFVTTGDGTGLVHLAPGFGEDDLRVAQEAGIPFVCPVDEKGLFTAEVADYQGIQVFEANKLIIQRLKSENKVIRHESYEHNYPHCWRTDTPLIYKAVSSWYVKVTAFKDRMVELNREIKWVPEHIRDGQFGKWLENARDWAVSRTRFWGTPIPIWKSDDPNFPRIDVYGSIAELERDFGVKVTDLHRPEIDNLVRPNPDDPSGKSKMRRVIEVLDVWFDSGSMPFAQLHYPFENKEKFEQNFPADFIVEYVSQTRGWFYTLMVLSTALFDKQPFLNCMCHGVVLDEDGHKLSKRLKNYPSPQEVFQKYGADALRWFLVSSPIVRGGDLTFDRHGKGLAEVVRSILNPIWSAYYFFTLYANSDKITATRVTSGNNLLDNYILAKTRELQQIVNDSLEVYDIPSATYAVSQYLEALNNWYIRRSRERFWRSKKDDDKILAYNTLFTVICSLCEITAPLLPLLTETIYRGLTGLTSVHLIDWPKIDSLPKNQELVASMDIVREVCSIGLSLREAHKLRTRLPLQSVTIAGSSSSNLQPFIDLIKDELNVKEVLFTEDFSTCAEYILNINSRILGPKIGSEIKNVLLATKSGQWIRDSSGKITVAGITLDDHDYTLNLKVLGNMAGQTLASGKTVVLLDINVTADLENEGLARDLVRTIQQARKDAGLHVADSIELEVIIHDSILQKITPYIKYIKEQTLAVAFNASNINGNTTFITDIKLGEYLGKVNLRKI